jgi:putative chitobiose transport system permease protein
MAYSSKQFRSARRNWAGVVRSLTPYLFLAPALIVLALTVFWPAVQAFYLSFTRFEYDLTQAPAWVGFANFQKLWHDPVFWKTLGNTVLYLVCVVPILVSLPLGLAILVNQNLSGIRWFRTAYYTPVVISMVVAGIAWKWLYASNGLLNQGLQWLGISSEGIPWLTSPDLSLFSVMAVTVWKGLGYYMVIYLAGLQGIPADLYEAAAIDGSDGFQKHWDITIPLMRPYLFLVAVISSISATKVFEEIFIMTKGEPLNSSKTIVYYLYQRAFQDLEMSYACAIGLVLFLMIFGLSILNLKLGQLQQ